MVDFFQTADWLTAALAFMAVFLGALSLVLLAELIRGWWVQRTVRNRLSPAFKGDGGNSDLLRTQDYEGAMDKALGQFSQRTGLGALLRQADSTWSLPAFLILSVGLAVGTGAASTIITQSNLIRLPWMGIAAMIPFFILQRRRKARLSRFEEGLPEAIDLLSRAIRAGHPLSSGVGMVGDEAAEPVAQEFRTLYEEQRFGIPLDEALMGMVDRIALMDVRIFSTAVLVQREVGGNLAELLDNIARTMRERFTIRRQLRVYTAQGRMSGYVLAVMPFVVGTGLWILDPDYMGALIFSYLGRLMLGIALVMWIIGFIWIRKIVDIDL